MVQRLPGVFVFRGALMGNQSTQHFLSSHAGFNIQVLLQNKQHRNHSEPLSSVPFAACFFHGFLIKPLVLRLHVPQQQQSLLPADAHLACAETQPHVSKAEVSEVCRIRNVHT